MRRSTLSLAFALTLALPAFAPHLARAQPADLPLPAKAAAPRGFNAWRDVPPEFDGKLETRAIIEIPKGSKNKYEIDKPTGLLKLDRVLRYKDGYPADYGFIPKTYADDHDPLDVLVLSSHSVPAMTIVPIRVIGVMRMVDQGEGDDKLIAVSTGDVAFKDITDLNQLPKEKIDAITTFFREYKIAEGKSVEVGPVSGPEEAHRILATAFKDYETLERTEAAKTKASESKDRPGLFSGIARFFDKVGSTVRGWTDGLLASFRARAEVKAPARDVSAEPATRDALRGPRSPGMSETLKARISAETDRSSGRIEGER